MRSRFAPLLALALLGAARAAPADAAPPDAAAAGAAVADAAVAAPARAPTQDGYRGIWFALGQRSEHGDKYSGGLGTYTSNHLPLAVYAPAVKKTFFVYGGTRPGNVGLLAMIGAYDHAKGLVSRPVVVHDKTPVDDPHDNPSLSIDDAGHLWVFVSGRGRSRAGIVYRSVRPNDTGAFEKVLEQEMAYLQPWWMGGDDAARFFLFLTRYTKGRELYFATSPDGRTWSPPTKLAGMGGHYQVSARHGERLATVFNLHPRGDMDKRTNLYYVETRDRGRTWRTVDGRPVELPLADGASPTLVRDYRADGRLVYLNDLAFDAQGRPFVLYVTSASHLPGPPGDPRLLVLARWTGRAWKTSEIARVGHNYQVGSLYVEPRGDVVRVLAPTERGPQPVGHGGEVALWESRDGGARWRKVRDVTRGSAMNHGYVRRPLDARADFAAFWTDGNPDKLSPSRLYFTNARGTAVWRLPYDMAGETARPERVPLGRATTQAGEAQEGRRSGTARAGR